MSYGEAGKPKSETIQFNDKSLSRVKCPVCAASEGLPFRVVEGVEFFVVAAPVLHFCKRQVLAAVEQDRFARSYDATYWAREDRSAWARSHGAALARVAEVFLYARRPIRRFLDIGPDQVTFSTRCRPTFPPRGNCSGASNASRRSDAPPIRTTGLAALPNSTVGSMRGYAWRSSNTWRRHRSLSSRRSWPGFGAQRALSHQLQAAHAGPREVERSGLPGSVPARPHHVLQREGACRAVRAGRVRSSAPARQGLGLHSGISADRGADPFEDGSGPPRRTMCAHSRSDHGRVLIVGLDAARAYR